VDKVESEKQLFVEKIMLNNVHFRGYERHEIKTISFEIEGSIYEMYIDWDENAWSPWRIRHAFKSNCHYKCNGDIFCRILNQYINELFIRLKKEPTIRLALLTI
jgi:hypothetical protein